MESTRVLEARARTGDLDALFRLGHRLAYGRNRRRPEPWPEIAALWSRCLDGGLPRARLHLARLYADGRGVTADPQRAFELYVHAAAIDGFTAAQYELGTRRRDGDGLRQDLHDSVNWFAIGAASGDADCLHELGRAFEDGLGRRKNRRTAVGYFRRAARQGHACAMADLADCYAAGHGVTRSPRWARYWMQRAAAAGNGRARRWLRQQA